MLDRLAGALDTSTTVALLVVMLIAIQVTVQVYALVDLARRPAVRGGRKWIWALAVALGNLPGAIAYLVAGREGEVVAVARSSSGAATASGDSARKAMETLYGPRDRS